MWWWCCSNRSLDNVLGRLYGPGDGKDFDGVIGKSLGNLRDIARHFFPLLGRRHQNPQ
jgi:hypothetical protein